MCVAGYFKKPGAAVSLGLIQGVVSISYLLQRIEQLLKGYDIINIYYFRAVYSQKYA